jgi:hypothetical protein
MDQDQAQSERREQARRRYAEGQEPSYSGEKRDWQAIIDEQAAQIDVDRLPGKGKPLNLARNPYVDEADEMANSLIKNAGFTLPWIEEGQRIDAGLAAARVRLAGARAEFESLRDAEICVGHQWVEGAWQAALREFRQAVEDLNRQIRDYNLKAPHASVHKHSVRLDEELARIGVAGD